MTNQNTAGIYLHIPFCIQKCNYCDFCSTPCANTTTMKQYTHRLAGELRRAAPTATAQTFDTVYFGGEHDEVHNIFSNSVSQAYHDAMKKYAPGKRSFVLTRTGTAGIQREPTALWTGDMYSEYGTLKAHIPEALNTQLSGIPMWTCDTGGFL